MTTPERLTVHTTCPQVDGDSPKSQLSPNLSQTCPHCPQTSTNTCPHLTHGTKAEAVPNICTPIGVQMGQSYAPTHPKITKPRP